MEVPLPPIPPPSRNLTPVRLEKTGSSKTTTSNHSTSTQLETGLTGGQEEDIINVEELLTEFRWKAGKEAGVLESSLLDELASLETANIGAVLETDSQVEGILSCLDLALTELDEIDGWLTLYKTELDSLGDDVFQIQALNEGLQTQSRNQKSLLSELELVLGKVAVPEDLTNLLRQSNFESREGMERILRAAASVQSCIQTNHEDGVKDMSVVNEQMEVTINQSNNFSSRVFEYLKVMFIFQVDSAMTSQGKGAKLRIDMKKIKEELSKYRGLTLWLKEMDPSRHNELQQAYSTAVAKIYGSEYKGLPDTYKSLAQLKKTMTDDAKYLFTSGNSAKLAPTLHRRTGSELVVESKNSPDSMLVQILNVIFPDIIKEQNFFCQMFHIGSNTVSFQSWVANIELNQKPIKDAELLGLRKAQKDVKIRKRISENMERMFGNLSAELGQLGELLVKYDWTLLVAFISKSEAFAEKCEQSNQEFLLKLLNNILNLFRLQLDKNIDEQVKALNDQEVSGKKRQGILSFFRTFPEFLSRMESLVGTSQTLIRQQIDKAYQRIISTMFEHLEVNARQSGHDEKELLNLHIITLENMHHFYSETGRYRKNSVIGTYNEQAKASYKSHLQAYVKDVIRRPLGKLLEFFEGIDNLLQNGGAPQEVGFHISYNKAALRKVIVLFPAEEVKKSIGLLYKRVTKHFSEEEGLLQVVWREIQDQFIFQHTKISKLITKCYPDSNINLEFTIEDLIGFLSKVTKIWSLSDIPFELFNVIKKGSHIRLLYLFWNLVYWQFG